MSVMTTPRPATKTTSAAKKAPPKRTPAKQPAPVKTVERLAEQPIAEAVTPVAAAYVDPLRMTAHPSLQVAVPAPEPAVSRSVAPAVAAVSQTNPYRVWTAGPNTPREKVYMPGHYAGLRPATDGAYYLTSPEQVAHMRGALGARFWPDDIPEGEPDVKCDTCGWHCRSFRAMHYHTNHAHGRPQSV